jgi:uncharacterized protein
MNAASASSATASLSPADSAALHAAFVAKGKDYVLRTRHKNADGTPIYINRLILESSPYLLQHAHNPVDWFPWGDEAFARARALGRPVFLSIGYSTCHWCHVMEEESFEDEETARYLNDHYVSIKVDREERPDVDATYMAFVQAFTGSGGWPMSVWVTPDREPFFGGTYFPPRPGPATQPGFQQILTTESDRYVANPAGIAADAKSIGLQWQARAAAPAGDMPSASVLTLAASEAARRFDSLEGGSRGAPKFPSSFPNRLLLRVARRTHDPDTLKMVTTTLDHMGAGGIHDPLGGGFHRYSTDAHWLVPHFEKMLYDNALLATDYLEAGQASGDPRYVAIARETLDYLLRDMLAPDGTFYSATDADSTGLSGRREEGAFFTWTPAEARAALGPDDAPNAILWFGIEESGQVAGRSVLHTPHTLAELRASLTAGPVASIPVPLSDDTTLAAELEKARKRLFDVREQRPKPLRDDKINVAWNGLTISALARAAIVFGDRRYADAALHAASKLNGAAGEGHDLPHELIDGRPKGLAFAEDYAFLAAAYCDVFDLTSDPIWIARATTFMNELDTSFVDETNGGYFTTSARHEKLLLRDKPMSDGPIPSASSIAALTWLRLSALGDVDSDRKRAEATIRSVSPLLSSRPLILDQMLIAFDWETDSDKEIVIVVHEGGGALADEARPFLDALTHTFMPNASLVIATESALAGDLGKAVPWALGKTLQGGRATAYVCEHGTCKLPTSDPKAFAQLVSEARPYP